MVRTQIQLTEDQSKTLKEIANREGVSMASVIRKSIDQYIRLTGTVSEDEKRKRALSVIGIGSSGTGDIASKHDEYLAEIYGEIKE